MRDLIGKKIDIIGKKFNNLLVISEYTSSRNGHIKYLCKCDCGKEVIVFGDHLRRNNTKSCGCLQHKKGENHPQWSGVGDISGNFWNSIVRGANGRKGRKSLELNITINDAWDLFLKQNRKCALSGIDLYFGKRNIDNTTASLDRINSSKGYIKGNIQWVHKDINYMKRIYSNQYFIDMCKLIAENNK